MSVCVVPKKQANPVDTQVGNRVRIRRMLIGMSQEKLGEALGLTFQQVQKYEKGVNRIGAGTLFRIAAILQVPVAHFFEGISDAPAAKPASDPALALLTNREGLA